MGRRKKEEVEAEQSRSVSLTTKVLKEAGKSYDAAKQKVSDAAMAVAGIMKDFQKSGGNNNAFILARKISRMEEAKAQDFLRSLHMYLTEFGVYQQLDLLDETPTFKTAAAPKSRQAPAAPSVPNGVSAHH